ncbi:MAG: hypothetical protein ACK4YQ_03235 [Phenylobacterium sp.]|uniref:hypothetical protein n=1 Tax=Phenylobacterium sp. TaxID=1871053 RepID=UPI00391D8B5C
MSPERLPLLPRIVTFGFAVTVLLWLSLVPSSALPRSITFWDKAEHALAYLVLTGLGLLLFPRRPLALIGGVLVLGVGLELLQAATQLGRQGDWRDVVANATGVAAAAVAVGAFRRRRAP